MTKALSIILKLPRRSNCKEKSNDLNHLSVAQRLNFNVLTFIYKLKNIFLPQYLCQNVVSIMSTIYTQT